MNQQPADALPRSFRDGLVDVIADTQRLIEAKQAAGRGVAPQIRVRDRAVEAVAAFDAGDHDRAAQLSAELRAAAAGEAADVRL